MPLVQHEKSSRTQSREILYALFFHKNICKVKIFLAYKLQPEKFDDCPFKLSLFASQVSATVVSTGAAGGVVISPSPSPSCLSAASSIDNLTTPLADITVGGATGTADGASGSDRKEGEGTSRAVYLCVCVCVLLR